MITRALSLAFVLSLAATAPQAQGFAAGGPFLENWDRNEDGAVTQGEVAERRAEIFTTFDADNDGSLSAAEFASLNEAREAMRAQMQGDMAGMGMGMGHGKGKGQGRGMGYGMAEAEGFQLAMNDANGDGTVTRAEFVDRTPQFFARMDRNGNGRITTEDFGRN